MGKKVSVSYLVMELGYTGGCVVLYNLMNKLCEDGYDVFVVTPQKRIKWQSGMEQSFLNSSEAKPRKGFNYRINRIKKDLFGSFEKLYKGEYSLDEEMKTRLYFQQMIKNLISNWEPTDYTFATHSLTTLAAFELADKTVPLYTPMHYDEIVHNANSDDDFIKKMSRLSYALPINIIANSSWLKNEVKHRFNKDAYLLTPAVSDEIFYLRNDIEEKYSNINTYKILSYADNRDFKGLADNIKVMKAIKEKFGNKVEITYFGGANPGETGFEYNYAGKVFGDDLGKLYSDSHILFLSSWFESFPLQPLEAQKSGTLVVSTIYGTEDYLNQSNSIIVNPRKIDEMSEAISKVINGEILPLSFVKNALNTSKEHTWQKSYETLLKIFEDVSKNNVSRVFSDVALLGKGDFANYWLNSASNNDFKNHFYQNQLSMTE